METDRKYNPETNVSLREAKEDMIRDMQSRDIGAIIWDNATAGFHQIPEIQYISPSTGEQRVARVTGLYIYNNELYLIEEDIAHVDIDRFYNKDTEVKPTVVTLSEDIARKDLGDPDSEPGYTSQGSLEEWLVIADCYFEALCEQ